MARPAPRGKAGGRLLVVAPNWLGDLVMATPALSCLAGTGERGGPELTLAVRRNWLPLVQGDPRLAGVLPVERPGRHGGWLGVGRLAAEWRAGGFAGVILMPPSLRVALAAWLAGIPLRVGQSADGRGWLLSHPVARPPRGAEHYSDELRALVVAWRQASGAAAAKASEPPPPALPACDRVPADVRLADGPVTWALGTGATYGDAKSWPPRRVAEFLDLAVAEMGARVLLLGDAAAVAAARGARAASKAGWRERPEGGRGVVDLVGRTGLLEAVGLLRGCQLFVGNDSGLMHLAAALGVPTIGLFGSTSPAWTGPRGPRTVAVVAAGFPCHPCFLRACPRDVFCLETIAGAEVLARARELLATGERGARP